MLGGNARRKRDSQWQRREAMPGGAKLGGKETGARPGGNALWQHQEATPCGNAGGNAKRQHAGGQH